MAMKHTKEGLKGLSVDQPQDRTWILLTALKYDEHLTLQNINSSDESAAVGEDAISEDDAAISKDDSNEITSSSASSRTLIVDIQRSFL